MASVRKTFPTQGGRCPSAHTGADEGAPEERKRQMFYLTHPHPSGLRPATFPLEGGRYWADATRPYPSPKSALRLKSPSLRLLLVPPSDCRQSATGWSLSRVSPSLVAAETQKS